MMMMGSLQADRSNAVGHDPSYLPEGNPGMQGGGTYTGASSDPTIQDYENIFGPSARDIKTDLQRFKRHGRWHLPDVLKGPNPWLTDRIDGLITDATNSPFTTKILPYMYKEDADNKMKWNVWSFDEGMASRVPYESAARTLQQSKRSFSAYMVRHGMAIVLEHNFMMSPKGRENFKNQLNQLVGSIQYSNDFDVHMALVLAPSYQKTMREKFFSNDKPPSQLCREYCDLFGMMQKNVNALDILIEEAKAILKTWGGPMPDFLLCNSKLTFQLTMTPEKTNYITQGVDGQKRLKQGPDLSSYRGISVIHSRAFSLEAGQQPRDILRRRVRTAEYYRILPHPDNAKREFELYNEERDSWFTMTFQDLLNFSRYDDKDPAISGLVKPTAAGGGRTAASIMDHRPRGLGFNGGMYLGAIEGAELARVVSDAQALVAVISKPMQIFLSHGPGERTLFKSSARIDSTATTVSWYLTPFAFNYGMEVQIPKTFPVLRNCLKLLTETGLTERAARLCITPGVPRNNEPCFSKMLSLLQDADTEIPFAFAVSASERPVSRATDSVLFGVSLCFFQEVYRRKGIPTNCVEPVVLEGDVEKTDTPGTLSIIKLMEAGLVARGKCDRANFFLNPSARGSVNHPHFLLSRIMTRGERKAFCKDCLGGLLGRSLLLDSKCCGMLTRNNVTLVSGASGTEMYGYEALKQTAWGDVPAAGKAAFKDMIKLLVDAHTTPFCTRDLLLVLIAAVVHEFMRNIVGEPSSTASYERRALAMNLRGVSTFPMVVCSRGHLLHPDLHASAAFRAAVNNNQASLFHGLLTTDFLSGVQDQCGDVPAWHPFFLPLDTDFETSVNNADPANYDENDYNVFRDMICERFTVDPSVIQAESFGHLISEVKRVYPDIDEKRCAGQRSLFAALAVVGHEIISPGAESTFQSPEFVPNVHTPPLDLNTMISDADTAGPVDDGRDSSDDDDGPSSYRPSGAGRGWTLPAVSAEEKRLAKLASKTEFVIVRPNIEHNMLGIILGLGGSELGHTLWGQTELSCYDDSMHGIWGMSYKYHERAIVFKEKNLVRLWDIAYDGYNGGKDDTHVDWANANARHGYKTFQERTMDLGTSYRGPSMMVLKFSHDEKMRMDPKQGFQRNWPSPIVFHDLGDDARGASEPRTIPIDTENLQIVDTGEFRVFDKELYKDEYRIYRTLMPPFHELHKMRKSAGQASAEAETQTDSLAFQGSMRIKHEGRVIQEIQGSGHHGPDYVGAASVRAGKGIKYSGQAPMLSHMV